jgi:hypothetical protein
MLITDILFSSYVQRSVRHNNHKHQIFMFVCISKCVNIFVVIMYMSMQHDTYTNQLRWSRIYYLQIMCSIGCDIITINSKKLKFDHEHLNMEMCSWCSSICDCDMAPRVIYLADYDYPIFEWRAQCNPIKKSKNTSLRSVFVNLNGQKQ